MLKKILANATIIGLLSITSVQAQIMSASATNGAVYISSDGKIEYSPNANFYGTDTISYKISDGKGGFSESTVSVQVNPINDTYTGSLSLVGTAEVGHTLTISDSIKDVDGINNAVYNWYGDSKIVATGVSQYTIIDTIKSTIQATKSYNDSNGYRIIYSELKTVSQPKVIKPLELPTLPFTNIVEAPTYEVADLEASNDFYQVDTIYNVAMEEYVLPKEVSGNFIEWSSNDRRVNFTRETNEGNQVIVFSHPANFDGDKNITLTAKYDNNVEQKTENVSITLKAKTRSKVKVLVIRVRYIGIDGESRVATSDDFFSKEEHYSGRNRLMRLSAGAVEIENYNDQIETGESSKTGWFIENETKNDGMIVLRVPEELAPINLTGRQDLSANHIAFYKIIDDIVDFKSLDLNNDGYVERSEFQLVLVDGNQVRSGSAASAGYTRVLDFTTGWSIPEYDGIKVKAGTFNLSTSDTSTAQSSGSTIAHEFGHSLFTLADLYISDEGMTDSYNSFTNLSMMSAFSTGEELGNGSPMTASKIALGFIDPIISTEYSRRTKNELDIENYTEFVPAVIIKGNELSSIKKGGKYLIAEIRGNCKATPGDTRIDESILIEGCKERTGDLYYQDTTAALIWDSTIVINGVAFTKVNLSNARGDSGRQTRFSASNRINTSIKRLFRDEEYKQGSDSYGSSMEITLFQEGDRITSKTKHYNTNAGSTTEYTVEELGFTVPDIKKNSITSFTLTVKSDVK